MLQFFKSIMQLKHSYNAVVIVQNYFGRGVIVASKHVRFTFSSGIRYPVFCGISNIYIEIYAAPAAESALKTANSL
jgi:hypothetical protein